MSEVIQKEVTEDVEQVKQHRAPKLNNSRADNPNLPADDSAWVTRAPFFPIFPKDVMPDKNKEQPDRRARWIKDNGLPTPTNAYRCCLISKQSRGTNGDKPRGTPSHPYECYAVDESEAKTFYAKTMGMTEDELISSRILVTKIG